MLSDLIYLYLTLNKAQHLLGSILKNVAWLCPWLQQPLLPLALAALPSWWWQFW